MASHKQKGKPLHEVWHLQGRCRACASVKIVLHGASSRNANLLVNTLD